MLHTMIVVAAFSLGDVEATAKPLSGTEVTGSLVVLTDQQLVLQTDGDREVAFATKDLLSLSLRSTVTASPTPEVWIELVDGSLLLAASYGVNDRRASLRTLSGERIELAARLIRAVRFKRPTPSLDGQWQEILNRDRTADLIVIRRSDTTLDELSGVLHNANEDKVFFEIDDEMVPVKRSRLEGVIYYSALGDSEARAVCRLTDVHGSTWRVRSMELAKDRLKLTSAAGVQAEMPLQIVQKIDFSLGNLVYLSDLEPASINWAPFVETKLPGGRLSQLYQPRRDRWMFGGKLQLRDETGKTLEFEKGLSLHSRTELVYRLTEKFKSFKALVGIDQRMRGKGNVVLSITGDDQPLWQQTITGEMAPISIALDIEGVRRLRVLVDYGEEGGIADYLNLCQARMTK